MSPWRASAAAVLGRYQAITPGSYGELITRVRGETGRKLSSGADL